jgi:hypothetical protein
MCSKINVHHIDKHLNSKCCHSLTIENYEIVVKIIEAAKCGVQSKF